MIIPSDAADAFVAPSNASYVATHRSALDLLDFSWVLVTWLDVLHGLYFGVMVTFVLFTFLAVCARWCASTKPTPTSSHPHKRIADWSRGYGEFHDLPLCGISRTSRPAGSDTTSTLVVDVAVLISSAVTSDHTSTSLHRQLPLGLNSLVLSCQT
jgi:hypothetical protein